MNLKRMLLLSSMALTAIAFAAPPVAQANVELTDINGDTVPVGEEVTATSTNLVTTLPLGRSMSCSKVTIHFEVSVNGLDHVVLAPVGQVTTESCQIIVPGVGAFPVNITDGTVLEDLTINTWGTVGPTTSEFTSDVPALGLANCTLEGDVHGFATHETDILHIEPSHLTGPGGGGCTPVGTIHGTFTLEDEDDNPVFIDFETTP